MDSFQDDKMEGLPKDLFISSRARKSSSWQRSCSVEVVSTSIDDNSSRRREKENKEDDGGVIVVNMAGLI